MVAVLRGTARLDIQRAHSDLSQPLSQFIDHELRAERALCDRPVGNIKPAEVEGWLEVLASTPQARKGNPLKWATIANINSVMR